jgi:hypothetical protein
MQKNILTTILLKVFLDFCYGFCLYILDIIEISIHSCCDKEHNMSLFKTLRIVSFNLDNNNLGYSI